jgi:hypothetical protein
VTLLAVLVLLPVALGNGVGCASAIAHLAASGSIAVSAIHMDPPVCLMPAGGVAPTSGERGVGGQSSSSG